MRSGTPFVDQFTGLLYAVIGPTRPGGFLVFSWIAFWGLFLFHRAALIGFPEADQRRYALLVFFLPSLLFWPSSIGKEALMLFGLGDQRLRRGPTARAPAWWWASLGIGLGFTYLVRPHVTAVLLGSIALAFVFRRSGKRPPLFGPAVRLLVVAGLIVVTTFALGQAADRILPQVRRDREQRGRRWGTGRTCLGRHRRRRLADRQTAADESSGLPLRSIHGAVPAH